MGKMTITAYTDGSFNSECKSALDLPINPDKVKLGKGITYAEDRQLGSLNGSNVYVRYKPETFCFECLLDMTAMDDDDEKKPVHDMVDAIEERLYDYNTEGHRPSFVKVQYGDITFFGQLKTLDTEYTLFDADGIPPPRRTESDADGLLQPEGGREALLQTFARRVANGHTE